MQQLISLLGVFVLVNMVAEYRSTKYFLRTVLWGVALQFGIAFVVLHPATQEVFFTTINSAVTTLLSFSQIALCVWGDGPSSSQHSESDGSVSETVIVGKVTLQ